MALIVNPSETCCLFLFTCCRGSCSWELLSPAGFGGPEPSFSSTISPPASTTARWKTQTGKQRNKHQRHGLTKLEKAIDLPLFPCQAATPSYIPLPALSLPLTGLPSCVLSPLRHRHSSIPDPPSPPPPAHSDLPLPHPTSPHCRGSRTGIGRRPSQATGCHWR